jgi:hypothetical protein
MLPVLDRTNFDLPFRGASALSVGWQVHYSLVRKHIALGTTPGIAAGVTNPGQFKWRAIIDLPTSAEGRRTD